MATEATRTDRDVIAQITRRHRHRERQPLRNASTRPPSGANTPDAHTRNRKRKADVKLFKCQSCGQIVYFEHTRCESCGHSLGYLP